MGGMRLMLWRSRVHVSPIESSLLRGEHLLLLLLLLLLLEVDLLLLRLLLLVLLSLLKIHHQRIIAASVQDIRGCRSLHSLVLTIRAGASRAWGCRSSWRDGRSGLATSRLESAEWRR